MRDIPNRLMPLLFFFPWILLGSMTYGFMCLDNLTNGYPRQTPFEFYFTRLGLLIGFSIMSAEFWAVVKGSNE